MGEKRGAAGPILADDNVFCPECGELFPRAEDLGPHLERHRPVDGPEFSLRGKLRSVHCPKGCGRWFVIQRGGPKELRQHERLCDGSPPLAPQKRRYAMAKWRCKEHDYRTENRFAWGQHKRHHHGGKEPGEAMPPSPKSAVRAAEKPARKSGTNSSLDNAIEELSAKKERLEEQIRAIDEAIEVLVKVK
jgi:hypothetical protein